MTSVLLVEDEPSVAHVVADMLRDWGYEVVLAYDGAAALAAYDHRPVDAVVSDFLLPKLDGAALFRALADLSHPPRCSILVSELEIAYLRRVCPACDAYLQKPFTAEDLASALRACLANPSSSPQTPE